MKNCWKGEFMFGDLEECDCQGLRLHMLC